MSFIETCAKDKDIEQKTMSWNNLPDDVYSRKILKSKFTYEYARYLIKSRGYEKHAFYVYSHISKLFFKDFDALCLDLSNTGSNGEICRLNNLTDDENMELSDIVRLIEGYIENYPC